MYVFGIFLGVNCPFLKNKSWASKPSKEVPYLQYKLIYVVIPFDQQTLLLKHKSQSQRSLLKVLREQMQHKLTDFDSLSSPKM